MARRFTDLLELTTPAMDDLFAVVDVSADVTKRITLDNMLKGNVDAVHIKDNAIIKSKVADGAIGTAEFKPTTIQSNFTPAASRFGTTSTSYVTVTNCSMNYTSGPTPERLYLWLNVMALSSPGNSEIALFVDNTEQLPRLYIDPGSPWVRAGQALIVDVAANTTIALSVRGFAASGSTLNVTNEVARWMPSIRGFSAYNGA